MARFSVNLLNNAKGKLSWTRRRSIISKSREKKEEKSNYETLIIVRLDDVATASGQVPGCTTGSAAAGSCAVGGAATTACATGGTNNAIG